MTSTTYPYSGAPATAMPRRRPRGAHSGAPASAKPDAVRIAVFILTVVGISKAHIQFPLLAALHPGQLTVAAALIGIMMNPASVDFSNLSRSWHARIILSLVGFALVAAPFGLSVGASAQYFLDDYSKVVVHALLLILILKSVADLRLLVWAYFWNCAVMVYLAVFVFQTEQMGSQVSRIHDMGAYDSNDFGCIVIAGVPLALVTFHTSGRAGKIISLVLLFGMGAAFARTGSRGGFLGMIVLGLALLLGMRIVPITKRILATVAVAAALFISAPAGYWEQMSTMLNIEDDYNMTSVDGRKAIALRGVGYMLSYPVFGIGMANFGRAEITISDKVREAAPGEGIFMAAAHNTYVQVGAELGVPGLALWCSLLFGTMFSLRRLRKRVPKQWMTGNRDERFLFYMLHYLPLSFLGFAVTSTFVSFAFLEPMYALAAIAAGVTLATERKLREGTGPRVAVRRPRRFGGPLRPTPGYPFPDPHPLPPA